MAGLRDLKPATQQVWNRLREEEVQTVLDVALKCPEESPRELACRITDAGRFSVSESTVYRILKREGLITPAVTEEIRAAKEYHQKTTRALQVKHHGDASQSGHSSTCRKFVELCRWFGIDIRVRRSILTIVRVGNSFKRRTRQR